MFDDYSEDGNLISLSIYILKYLFSVALKGSFFEKYFFLCDKLLISVLL